jgi:hypothetical protein
MADQWKTYEEAGALFGLSAEAMRKRARRLRWQVQPPNDTQGKTRILVPENAALRPAGPPPGIPSGDRSGDRADDRADGLSAELRRRAEAAEAERERVEGERESLAAELITERERRARAEGEAVVLREVVVRQDLRIEQEIGRAERAESRAERVPALEAEAAALRDAAAREAARADTAEAARQVVVNSAQALERELATVTAAPRQVPGITAWDVVIGAGGGAVVAFITWAVLR